MSFKHGFQNTAHTVSHESTDGIIALHYYLFINL